jgi:REP element-mobilizing transposase RayT
MATPKRVVVFNTPYHITTKIVNSELWFYPEKAARKNKKRFSTNMSIKRFMIVKRRKIIKFIGNLIGFMKKKYGFIITHFVLMDTHYHLIGECRNRQYPINRCMQTFNMMLAKWINQKTGRTGALFAKRYSSNVIMDETYGKLVLGYIYANPVKAGIAMRPEEHDCTSYKQYVRGKQPEELFVYENCKILQGLTEDSTRYGEILKELVEGYIHDRLEVKTRDFKQRIKAQVLITEENYQGLSKYKQRKFKQFCSFVQKL